MRRRWLVTWGVVVGVGCSGMDMPPPPNNPPPPGTSLEYRELSLYRHTLAANDSSSVWLGVKHEVKAIDTWFENCNVDLFPTLGHDGRTLHLKGFNGTTGSTAFGDTFYVGSFASPYLPNLDTLKFNREVVAAGEGLGMNGFPTKVILADGLAGVMVLGVAPNSQNYMAIDRDEDGGKRNIVLAHEIGHSLSLNHVDSTLINQYVMHPNADLSGDLITETECLLAHNAGQNLNYFD